jgi:hypothetical protein
LFLFILCASVFPIRFSILIFALIIYILFFISVEKIVSFTLYIRMVEIKNIYLTGVFSYTYKFHWNWKKYIKKIVIFYYISGYHFTIFLFTLFSMILFFLYIFLSLFPNLYYFFVQIAFFFFSFFLNFTLNSRKPWRERVYINCCFWYKI